MNELFDHLGHIHLLDGILEAAVANDTRTADFQDTLEATTDRGACGLADHDKRVVRIDDDLVPNVERLVLLHEMCHVGTREEAVDHGPEFVRQLERLAGLGEAWVVEAPDRCRAPWVC